MHALVCLQVQCETDILMLNTTDMFKERNINGKEVNSNNFRVREYSRYFTLVPILFACL